MTEHPPGFEPPPPSLETRRDALFLRIIKMRESIQTMEIDREKASRELADIHNNVLRAVSAQEILLLEEAFNTLEDIINAKKP